MNDLDEKTLRRIDWQELLPPVMLLRIFACATKMRVLFYAMAGMLLSIVLGCLLNFCVAHWRDSHDALSPDMFVTEESDEAFLTRLADHANQTIPPTIFQTPADIEALVGLDSAAQHQEQAKFLEAPARWLWECALRSVAIPWQFFSSAGISAGKAFFTLQEKNTLEIGCALLWLLMLVINWCLFGGLICRNVALRLTVDETEPPKATQRFFKKCGGSFLSGLFIILLGILCCLIPLKIAAWLFSVPTLNILVGVLFPIVLLFGFFAVILLLGLLVGWPLLFASVAVDGADGFEAVSRSYSYLYQRPLHYLLYWILAAALGVLGYILVAFFIDAMMALCLGMFPDPLCCSASQLSLKVLFTEMPLLDLPLANRLVVVWYAIAQLIKLAFVFAWFWSSAVAIYLLLRRSVDATPLSEVLQMEAAEPLPLPDLKEDEKGALGTGKND